MFRQASEIASELWNSGRRHSLIRVVVLLSMVALFAMPTPPAQAQGECAFYLHDTSTGHDTYIRIPPNNILATDTTLYTDPSCQTRFLGTDGLDLPLIVSHPYVYAGDSRTAWKRCEAAIDGFQGHVELWPFSDTLYRCKSSTDTKRKQGRVRFGNVTVSDISADASDALAECQKNWPQSNHVVQDPDWWSRWYCYFVWNFPGGGGSGGGRGGFQQPLLPLTGLRLDAFDGMESGIQFNRLSHYGVGDPNVIAMGFLDAVDIWSNVGSGYSVCFPQVGRIVFLDAASSPRTLVFPDYHHEEHWTCASLYHAGTMVLVKSSDTASSAAATTTSVTVTRRPGTDDSVDDAITLEDCLVTPRLNLRLRAAPWGTIRDVIPLDTEVQAKARTENWFSVSYEETDGWSAEWLADSEGECDWTGVETNG